MFVTLVWQVHNERGKKSNRSYGLSTLDYADKTAPKDCFRPINLCHQSEKFWLYIFSMGKEKEKHSPGPLCIQKWSLCFGLCQLWQFGVHWLMGYYS